MIASEQSEVPPEALPPPSREASVVLDIGGDVGAAIVQFTPDFEGTEIEIRPLGSEWAGTHVAVRPRVLGAHVQYAALYGSLRSGSYDLRVRGSDSDKPVTTLVVHGGRVTETRWPFTARR